MTEPLLTAEEIRKRLPSDAFHLAEDDLKSGQKIAHAQLVKVVAWLEEHNQNNQPQDKALVLFAGDWQKLKEMGQTNKSGGNTKSC